MRKWAAHTVKWAIISFQTSHLPDEPEYQIGKYGRMRRSYLKEHRPILYTNLLTSGTLHRHLAEIDQACNERMQEIIVSDIARQEDVAECAQSRRPGYGRGAARILVTARRWPLPVAAPIRAYGGTPEASSRLHPPGVPRQAGPASWASGLLVGPHGYRHRQQHQWHIVMAGPIAKEVGGGMRHQPQRSASRLDTFSCIFQGIIPYGAQMLVAIFTCATLGYAISAFDIIPLLFYPFLLCLSSLLFILFDKK
ncbi:MAG: TnpV protein [Oscillospiraceae bacterium]